MTPHISPDHLDVVKPSGTAWKAGPLVLAGLFAVVIAVNFDPDDLGPVIMLAVAAVVVVGIFVVVLLRTRLEIGRGLVVRHGATGSTRVTADAVDRVVWIPLLQTGQTGRTQSRLVVVDRGGRAALRLTTTFWAREALVEVAQTFAPPARLVSIDRPVTVGVVKQVEPAALSWGERHPGQVIVLALVGTFVGLAALFGIFVLTS